MGRANWSSRGGAGRGRGRGRGGRGGGRGRRHEGGGGGVDFRDPQYNDGVQKGVAEAVVGIRAFLSPDVAGFHGSTKARYSDFVVREVALDGSVVRLRDVPRYAGKPTKPQKVSEVFKQRVFAFLDGAASDASHRSSSSSSSSAAIPGSVRLLVGKLAGALLGRLNRQKRERARRHALLSAAKLREAVATVCDDRTAQSLETFVVELVQAQHESASITTPRRGPDAAGAGAGTSESDAFFFFPEMPDKAQRARVHALVRELAGELLVSDTAPNADGVAVVRVRKAMVNGKKRRDVDQRGGHDASSKWPASRPDYLQFTLYKKNAETNSVMQQLARAMNLSVSALSYAGTKDKRGLTTQQCTIFRGSKKRLEMLNRAGRELDDFNFLVGDATYVPAKLRLGDLRGNLFSLAIRDLPSDEQVSDDEIRRAVDSWATRGFINYFGLQRFGTKTIPTHEVGRAILQRDHERAARLLLQPQEGDATKIREARQKFQDDRDAADALRALPPYLVAERALLHGLQTHGANAFSTALQCIPRHLRMMYTHAYQSFIWNSIASERLTKYATDKPIVGDLVMPVGDQPIEELVDDDAALDGEATEEDADAEPSAKKPRVERAVATEAVLVTHDNMHQYSIYDVVLPLPGYDIRYPENALKQRYEELLAADGVDFQSLHRATNSEYHLPGSFRHLLKRPERVAHEIKRYDDPTVALLETDVDRLLKRQAQPSIAGGKYRALCLEFQLSPSSYATMAVRELLKQSSNIDAQPSHHQP